VPTRKRDRRLFGNSANQPGKGGEAAVVETIRKVVTWIAVVAVVILAILLPVIVVTGMFGGEPLAGTVALIGMVLLAFGVAWYVRSHGERSRD
jgi:uncharacterized membrane protein